jgi:hypothetical protein
MKYVIFLVVIFKIFSKNSIPVMMMMVTTGSHQLVTKNVYEPKNVLDVEIV